MKNEKTVIIYLKLPAGDPRQQLELLSAVMSDLHQYGAADFEFIDSDPHAPPGRDRP